MVVSCITCSIPGSLRTIATGVAYTRYAQYARQPSPPLAPEQDAKVASCNVYHRPGSSGAVAIDIHVKNTMMALVRLAFARCDQKESWRGKKQHHPWLNAGVCEITTASPPYSSASTLSQPTCSPEGRQGLRHTSLRALNEPSPPLVRLGAHYRSPEIRQPPRLGCLLPPPLRLAAPARSGLATTSSDQRGKSRAPAQLGHSWRCPVPAEVPPLPPAAAAPHLRPPIPTPAACCRG